MRAMTVAVCATLLMWGTGADAAPQPKRLGTDPAGDGPPSLDILYLDVARTGPDLDIRIGLGGMPPRIYGVPEVPGIEWIFDVRNRTFVAEAVPGPNPRFFLFELDDDGSVRQLENPKGTFDATAGYAQILVPLDTIGARRGTRISGNEEYRGLDVDAHIHAGPQTIYPDEMATTKDFVVP